MGTSSRYLVSKNMKSVIVRLDTKARVRPGSKTHEREVTMRCVMTPRADQNSRHRYDRKWPYLPTFHDKFVAAADLELALNPPSRIPRCSVLALHGRLTKENYNQWGQSSTDKIQTYK